jgi:hypothetical protein
MKKTLLGFFLGMTFTTSLFAQIDTERIPPKQDSEDLFQRAAASQFVVIGTITKSVGISKRMTPELLKRVNSENDLSLAFGGTLYTISVESTVCRLTVC